MQQRFELEGKADSTGGSTGEPTHFLHDPLMKRTTQAAEAYTRIRMGWHPGMSTIIIWGSERDIGRSVAPRVRLNNWLLRDLLVAGYSLNRDTVKTVMRLIGRYHPVAIYGFTSMLEFVAREAVHMGAVEAGRVRTAWNGGEMLFPEQSELFRRAFGVGILNRYGGRELGAMACQFDESGPLHILRPWLFAEIVNEEGKPAMPGEPARLLWTSTVCRGTPFLRYDVGDLGVADARSCTEAGIGALRELQGRVAALLELPDGKRINNIFWNHLFKEYPEVHQFQVRLKKEGRLEILLKGTGFAAAREKECLGRLRGFLSSVPFQVSWVEKIPLTPQGKLVHVVRE